MDPIDQQDLNARNDAGSFASAGSLASLEQEVKQRKKHRYQRSRQRLLLSSLVGVFVILVISGVGFSTYKFFKSRWFRQPADLFSVQRIDFSAGELTSSLVTIPLNSQNLPSQFGLNGNLRVGGNLSLSQQGITNLGQVLTNKLDLQPDSSVLAQSGNALITGTAGATVFTGGGSQVTSLSASNISTGILAPARLSPDVSLLGQSVSVAQIQPNVIASVNNLYGNGGDIALAGNGGLSVVVNASGIELNQIGTGAGITQVIVGVGLTGGGGSSLVGVDIDGGLATLQGNSFNIASQLVQLNGGGALVAFDGSLLTSLSANALTAGTIDDARLTSNVIIKDLATNVLIPSSDSTESFAIRNAAGTQNVIRGDSVNHRISIGYPAAAAPAYSLDINGDINVEPPSSTLLIGGVQICGTLTCTIQDGSANYVQNSTVMQTSANIAIQSAGFSSIAGRIRGITGQTANLLQIEDENIASVFEVSKQGSLLLQGEYLARPAAAAKVFSVAYSATPIISVLRVDTDTDRVGLLLGDAQTPQYRLDLGVGIGGDTNLAAGSVMRVGGVAVCSSLGCSDDGSSIDYIRNSTSLQASANFFIQSATSGGIAAVRFAGVAGQIADIFSVEDNTGDQVLSVSNIGETELAAVTNTNDTLEVLDTIGNARFVVDTISNSVMVSDSNAYSFGGTLSVNILGNDSGLVVNQAGSGGLLTISNTVGDVMQVAASGDTLFKTTTNATNAFSVMNSSASAILSADTSQGSINIGGSSYGSHLGIVTSGTKAGQVIANTGTGNSLEIQKSGTTVMTISDTGEFLVQPSANTTAALRVKSSAGSDILQVATGMGATNTTPALSFNSGANGEVGSWTANPVAMNKSLRDAGYAYLNGYMYRVGGTQQANRFTFNLESEVARAAVRADGSLGSWTVIGTFEDGQVGSFPTRSNFGITVINGAIYTAGGYRLNSTVNNNHNGSSFAKVQTDGTLSSWRLMTSMNCTYTCQRAEAPLVNDGYGNMYYIGGTTNYYGPPQPEIYTETVRGNLYTSYGSWNFNTGISSLPGARAGHRVEIANGYLYVIGGYSGAAGATVQSTVYYAKLNGTGGAGAWSTANALPTGLKYHCSGVANGYMYVWGGDTGSAVSNAIYYAKLNNDGSLGSWQTSTQTMPVGVASAGCATINGRLYSFGGLTGSGTVTNAVYYAETSKVRMYASLDLIGLDGTQLASTGEDSGASLMNGSGRGGSLSAGSISAVGMLQATGAAQFTGGVAVLDRLATEGDTLIRVVNNYADKSVVIDDNTGARVLTIDSYTLGETFGINLGETWGAIDAKMAVNGVIGGQNSMQILDTSNGILQAMTIADGGATTFTNDCSTGAQCDETQAFQIQNASAISLFTVDTLNSQLTLGSPTANFDIDFEQNSSNRGVIVRDFVCSASEAIYDVVEFAGIDTVARTTTASSNRVAGIVVAKPSVAVCTTAIAGVTQVNFGSNISPVSIGDPIETSGIAGAAQSTATLTPGALLGNSISSKDGSNRVWVRLRRD